METRIQIRMIPVVVCLMLSLVAPGPAFSLTDPGAGVATGTEIHRHGTESGVGSLVAGETRGSQETCPVMGGKIDRSVYTDYQGKRVYFCCPACISEFEKKPGEYIRKMEAAGVRLEAAPATKEQHDHGRMH